MPAVNVIAALLAPSLSVVYPTAFDVSPNALAAFSAAEPCMKKTVSVGPLPIEGRQPREAETYVALVAHVAQLEPPPKLYEAVDAIQAVHCGPAVPDGHHVPTHDVAPGPAVVVFDGHVKHVERSAETAPTRPNVSEGHTGPPRHGALAPTTDENNPGLHAVHCALAADVEPKEPTLPTAHGTPEQRGAAAADHVPETHIEQEVDVVSMVPFGPK